MLGMLRRLFRPADKLRKASRRMHGREFANAIASSQVLVLGKLQSDGIDPEAGGEQLLAYIEQHAKACDERTEVHLFLYERDGRLCLPFFSSIEACECFCGQYSKERNRIFPFEVYTVSGQVLSGRQLAADVVVLNDETPDARVLTDDERSALEEVGMV